MIKAVLFDLDGVLVDACDWHYYALNRALKEVAGYEILKEDHINNYNGLPTKVKLEMLVSEGLIEDSQKEEIWRKKQIFTIDVINENAIFDKEKVDLLNYLSENNFLIGCVTNSIKSTAYLMLEKTGQKKYLDVIITNEDVLKAKPSPEGYIKAIKHLKTKPANVLIVEDSDKGFEAAKNSRCHVLRVANSFEVNKISISNTIEKLRGM